MKIFEKITKTPEDCNILFLIKNIFFNILKFSCYTYFFLNFSKIVNNKFLKTSDSPFRNFFKKVEKKQVKILKT